MEKKNWNMNIKYMNPIIMALDVLQMACTITKNDRIIIYVCNSFGAEQKKKFESAY